MSHILDRVAARASFERRNFLPRTPQEFFALQLALKLEDSANIHRYLALVERFDDEHLIRMFHSARRHHERAPDGDSVARRFALEVDRVEKGGR